MPTEKGARLYQQVQDRIAALIHEGAFKPGQRIPSIRMLSGQLGVSINTVKEAYERLEMSRLIEARPQSGYYVMDPYPETPRARGYQEEDLVPSLISTEELYRRVMTDEDREHLIGNIITHLCNAQKRIQLRQTAVFYKADAEYGRRVAEGLNLDVKDVEKLTEMSQEERAKATA